MQYCKYRHEYKLTCVKNTYILADVRIAEAL